MKKNKGFTLAELLVVVAIIAVLVAISIPIFISQLHKAEVATDWANLRSYFSEIQADYAEKREYNPKVPDYFLNEYDTKEITFLDGKKVKLKAGTYYVTASNNNTGYQILYYCDKGHKECTLKLNATD